MRAAQTHTPREEADMAQERRSRGRVQARATVPAKPVAGTWEWVAAMLIIASLLLSPFIYDLSVALGLGG
jgi:hypothetical protein